MSVDRYKGFVFNLADLAEDAELDVERRKAILYAEAMVARGDHWEVLGLPWNASPELAKAAYLAKVKVFHPDRYSGKKLGSYRGRLERVFRGVTEARDLLVDPARRAEYVSATAPAPQKAQMAARKIEDERRSEERRARLARQNPFLARAARVSEFARRGKAALAEGKFSQAANDLLLAQNLDPQNAEIASLAAEAKRRAAAEKAQEAYQRGLGAEAMGAFAAALAAFREALELDPKHVRAAAAGARTALSAGDAAAARELAEGAVRSAPGVGSAHEALGLVLEAVGARKEARRAFEKAMELDPKLEVARERLKKLRWSFL